VTEFSWIHIKVVNTWCIQNTESGSPWLSGTFLVRFPRLSRTIHVYYSRHL